MKRFLAGILGLMFVFSVLQVGVYGAEASDKNVAYARLGKTLKAENFALVQSGYYDTNATVTTRLGEECWLLDVLDGNNHDRIHIKLSEEMEKEKETSLYTVEVEYFDVPGGYFRIYYDSRIYKEDTMGTVYTQGENIWKKVSYTVDDGLFTERISNNRADIMLGIFGTSNNMTRSTASIPIKSIKITKTPNVNPVYVSSHNDAVGNAFRWYDENKLIQNTYENHTNQAQTLTVTHSLTNAKNYKAYEKTETVTLEPMETKTVEINIGDMQRCEVYQYNIDIKNQDGSINSHFEPYHISILKTDPDGIVNEDIAFAAHFNRYDAESIQQGVEMVAMSNTYGVRSDLAWSDLEKEKGRLTVEGTAWPAIFEALQKNNVKLMPILDYGNGHYMGLIENSCNIIAETPEEIKAWLNYVSFAVDTVKDFVDRYEVWNEPNYHGLNLRDATGAVYYNMFKETAKIVKEKDPGAKIGGPSVMSLEGSGRPFYDSALEAGLWKDADALTLHPYISQPVESAKMDETIWYYKNSFIEASGGKVPEIWNTETGYTCTDEQIGTEEVKGGLNIRAALVYKAEDVGDMITFYNFEKKGTIEINREDEFGHVRPGRADSPYEGKLYSPTNSYVMIAAYNYLMAQAESTGRLYDGDGNDKLYLYKFRSKKFNQDIVTLHSFQNARTATLKLGAKEITLYDEFGNPTELTSEDGIYTFVVDHIPRYIMGDITEFEVVEEDKIAFSTVNATIAQSDTYTVTLNGDLPDGTELVTQDADTYEITEKNDFKNQQASFTFLNKGTVGEQYSIDLQIQKDGEILHSGRVLVDTSEMISSELAVSVSESGDPNKWNATVKIKNNSNSVVQKGVLRINAPDQFAGISKKSIGTIPVQRTGEITFNLPTVNKKGQYTLDYDIITDTGTYNFIENIDFTIAKYAKTKPTIDGKMDKGEWNMNTMMYAESSDQIKQITDWTGPEDLSGRSCIMWDEEYYYMCLEVTDDVHVNIQPSSSIWKGDSVQFGVYYGDQGYIVMGQASATFHELAIGKSSITGEEMAWRHLSQDLCYAAGDAIDKCELAISRDGNKTIYEFRMKWENLLRPTDPTPKAGDMLGFSFLINEADEDIRVGWIEYASGIGEGKNSALFTYLTLID